MPLILKPYDGPELQPFTFSPSPPQSATFLDPNDGNAPSGSSGREKSRKATFEDRAAANALLRPPADFLQERDMPMLGARPLGERSEPGRGLLSCETCSRVVMEHAWPDHQRICRHILEGIPLVGKKSSKNVKAVDKEASKKRRLSEDSDDIPAAKRPALPADRPVNLLDLPVDNDGNPIFKGLKKGDMRRLQKEQERILRKQAKDQEKYEVAERKRLRTSGPVDLDRHCGVINDKGLPCSRSLTCKTHTVGAKRAVKGRSRSYDELHLEWQREHNPNFKEPARRDKDFGLAAKNKGAKRDFGSRKPGTGAGREEDRVVGEAELKELIGWTKTSAERCRLVIGMIGADGPGHGYLWNNAKIANGANNGLDIAPDVAEPPMQTLSDIAAQKAKTAARQARFSLVRPTNCNNIWSRQSEYENVGSLLVAALKARPPPKPRADDKARESKKKIKVAKPPAVDAATDSLPGAPATTKIIISNPGASANQPHATPVQPPAQLHGTPVLPKPTPRMQHAQVPNQPRIPTPQQQMPMNYSNNPALMENLAQRMTQQKASAHAQLQQQLQANAGIHGGPGPQGMPPTHPHAQMQYIHAAQNLPSFQAAAAAAANMQQQQQQQQQGMPHFQNGMPPGMAQAFQMQGLQGMPIQQQQQMMLNMQNMPGMQGMPGMQAMQGLAGMQGMGGMPNMQMGGQGWPQVQQGVEG